MPALQKKPDTIFTLRLEPFQSSHRIAATDRQSVTSLLTNFDSDVIAFTSPNDVFRLGKYSPKIESGTMGSFFCNDIMSPLALITALLHGSRGEFSSYEAGAIMTACEMTFSLAQVLSMLKGSSPRAKSLIRNGRPNMFPLQITGTEVAMLFAWRDYSRWNIRVSHFGYGRGTNPGVVTHVRNKY